MNLLDSKNPTPAVLKRPDHHISRGDISEPALKVLYRLKDADFQAYLVGGGVRDLLLGREPKDFDVVTDARPEQVRSLFRNCRLIGRRFRLAHVRFGREIIEVATFRASPNSDSGSAGPTLGEHGRIIRDNAFGTIEQDALRRDFTINSLYYDINDFSVVDYVDAMDDLRRGVLRIIGDPLTRFREDPVRMLRAVRFAAKLGFRIEADTQAAMFELVDLVKSVPAARLYDEVSKLFHGGSAVETFALLRHYGLFSRLFPATETALAKEEQGFPITFVSHALRNTDDRINSGKHVTPAFLYAVLLWEPVRHRMKYYLRGDKGETEALQNAGRDVIADQLRHTSIPKRFNVTMREIWFLQSRFRFKSGKRPQRFVTHPRFRAAYDFLCLRAEAGEDLQDDCRWWTEYQASTVKTATVMSKTTGGSGARRYRRRSTGAGTNIGDR
ncbi:MAG: polynucleotide adenylyltransferase PcnB [Gammaproteobacteria bacterium]|nr:polynucleotide adenylyltransferase PcnB [Gammaproteobacteria bacterium]